MAILQVITESVGASLLTRTAGTELAGPRKTGLRRDGAEGGLAESRVAATLKLGIVQHLEPNLGFSSPLRPTVLASTTS
jgi:hypothetical protein